MLHRRLRVLTACLSVSLLISTTVAWSDIPRTISFQGLLTDDSGTPVTDGAYQLTFRIYSIETGGSALWSEIHDPIQVEAGLFEVTLGSHTPMDLAFDRQYWIGITSGVGSEFSPRMHLTGSPYAFNAAMINGSDQVVRSVEGLADSIDLVAGSNIDISVAGNTITFSATSSGSGDITAVNAGEGLVGGGDSGAVMLAVSNPLNLYGDNSTGLIMGMHADGAVGYLASAYEGVFGSISEGTGVHGEATATQGATYGVAGYTYSTQGSGVFGYATEFTGTNNGVYGTSNSTDGRAVYGYASATSGENHGGLFESWSSEGYGVHGAVYANSGINYGVYGETYSTSGYGVYYSGGIGGTGPMKSIVRTSKGPTGLDLHTTTGNWIEDFGEGFLVDGTAHIEFDPHYLEIVRIDDDYPAKVFVELGGDCFGVYIVKRETGFDVIELQGGQSSAPFDYRVVAKRKGYEAGRLEPCDAAMNDPNLYPELRESRIRQLEKQQARLKDHRKG